MVKRLNPLNPLVYYKFVNSFNSVKLIHISQQKSFRFYNTNNINNNNNNNSSLRGNNFNKNSNNNIIDFSSESIELIRNRLKSSGKLTYNFTYDTSKEVGEAAVLVPLCVVDDEPSVLFTIRSMSLKTHTGEVSFPGGKKDSTDSSLESTALRETYEEIGIPPSQIDILGQDSTLPNTDRTIKVYPFIGFIKHPIEINKINFNKDEVNCVFSVTLKDLLDHDKKRWERFRDSKIRYPIFATPKEIGLEIWGLTAFVLESVLRKINLPPRKNESSK